MHSTLEKLDNDRVAFKIEVTPEALDKAIDAGYKAVAKQVNIPGFRKGKAPKGILKAYVGAEAAYREAMDILVPRAYGEALEGSGIKPVDYPEINVEQFEEGKPFVFTATVQCMPTVTLGQYKGLDVQSKEYNVTDADVENEIMNLRKRLGETRDTDRTVVAMGDLVTMDFVGRIEDEPFEGGTAEGLNLEIGSGYLIPGFEDQLVGAVVGEPTVVTVTFPEDYPSKELAGTEATFDVTVTSIKEKAPAELTDEFVKRFGTYDDVDAFVADVKKRMTDAALKRAEGQFDDEVLTRVSDNATVEIPEVMIQRRIDALIKEFEKQLSGQKQTLKEYYEVTGTEEKDLRDSLRDRATKEVKMDLVLDAVTEAENVEATDADIDEKVAEFAKQYGVGEETIRASFKNEDSLANLKERISREKTVKLLLDGYNKVVVAG